MASGVPGPILFILRLEMSTELFSYLHGFYKDLPPLSFSDHDHYWIAACRRLGLKHIRCITAHNLGSMASNTYFYHFMQEERVAAMYPMVFMGFHAGYGFRSLTSKSFSLSVKMPFLAYQSASVFENLKRNDCLWGVPFLLSEDVMSCEFLSHIYPFSFSYLKSSVSDNMAKLISYFTNKVIMVPDRDKAGERGLAKSKRAFNSVGVAVFNIELPSQYNDAGDILKDLLKEIDMGKKFTRHDIFTEKKGNSPETIISL